MNGKVFRAAAAQCTRHLKTGNARAMALSKKLIHEVMGELGRKGGKIGGKRSLETMTAAERKARATKASLAAAKRLTGERLERERKVSRKRLKGWVVGH